MQKIVTLTAMAVLLLGTGCGEVADLPPRDTGRDTAETDVGDATSDTGSPEIAPDDTIEPTDTTPLTGPSWHVATEGLPAALLSVWGSSPDDVWFAGADPDDDTGPWLVRSVSGTLARVDLRPVDARGGHLWWVFGPPDASGPSGENTAPVYASGEHGRLFAFNRTTEAVRRIETGTEATLYGIWGAGDGRLYAVGGHIRPATGPPTVVLIDRAGDTETTSLATLPSSLEDGVVLFKVWGAAPDNVFVVGEGGNVLHYDGSTWTHEILTDTPRLVTIHGRSADDIVVVGGTNQAVIVERGSDGVFTDASPGPFALLNGVFVRPDGDALAVGLFGEIFHRTDGSWAPDETVPVQKDWHATWVDSRGDAYVVGGNLLSAERLDEGVILRLGPDRTDVPVGPVQGLEPPVVADDVVESDADVVESDADVTQDDADVTQDDADVTQDDADVTETSQDSADTSAAEDTADDTTQAEDTVADTEADTTETEDSAADTAQAEDSAADTEGDTAPRMDYLDMGTAQFGVPSSFTPIVENQTLEIVNGGQGLLHVEFALRYDYPAGASENRLETAIVAETFIDDVQVGYTAFREYPTKNEGGGLFQTEPLTVIFNESDESLYVGHTATVRGQITLPDTTVRVVEHTIELVNDF